jgi:C7-cyclitol 7-kinase
MPALVFDLGGTHLRSGVATRDGVSKVSMQRVASFMDGLSPGDIAQRIESQIMDYTEAAGSEVHRDDPIVLAFPGPIAKRQFAVAAPTLYGDSTERLPDIAGNLRRNTGRAVHLLNDVSAAAWALSLRTSASRFMVVTVSSGIGSKIFDRGNAMPVLDEPAFSGEIGHFVVDATSTAPRCDCGGLGHLGAIASGRGVERMARAMRRNDSLTNATDIVPAIRNRQPWAIDLLKLSAQPLARTLVAVTMAIGLEKIFVIGGFAQAVGPAYGALLSELVIADSRYPVVNSTFDNLIELVAADDSLALAGAAHYATTLGLTT